MPTATKNNSLLAAALRYAEQGLPVFPCVNDPANPERHKKPHTKHGFKDATTNLATLRAWWGRWPNALIGMPTGKVTGIAVLDLDNKNGKDGFAAVPDWEQRSPVRVRTVNGGAHSYFKDNDELYCSDSVIAPGVDTRATGGYVIIPPSPGYHAVNGFDLTALPPWPNDLVLPERKQTVSVKPNAGEAETTLVAAALAVIPNDDLGWTDWNRIGMAAWRASGGSEDGRVAWAAWSAKSSKHDADTTDKRWEHYASSPPTSIGAGTLFYEANQADPGWRERAMADWDFPDVGKKGGLLKSLPNTVVALNKMGVDCKHDLFKLRYIVNGHQLDEQFGGDISDPALLRLRELIFERFHFDPATQTVHDAVRTLANHARFHPVRDYLDSLKWDGVKRIDTWLSVYCKAKDSEYTRAVGALVLMAAVRRVRKPGCKFDEIMVWENEEQGGDKSSGLATLAVKPEWFSDNLLLGASARETIEALSGHWIIEVSELQGMSKSEVEKVKAFASRSIDRARMVWDRTVTEARRQCIIIGTTNSERYLRDLTGNRRFWPVRVGRIDLKALERDRDQLWAEAAAREAEKGASIRLPQRLWPVAAREQQARVVDNPFVSVLDRALREGGATMDDEQRTPMQGKVMTEDLWTLLGLKTTQRTQPQFDLLGDAMKQLGWEKTHLRAGGPLKYYYTRGPKPHRHIIVVMISAQDGTPAYPVANYADGAPVNTEATEKAKEAAKAKEGTDF